jgi:hypothetical protein
MPIAITNNSPPNQRRLSINQESRGRDFSSSGSVMGILGRSSVGQASSLSKRLQPTDNQNGCLLDNRRRLQ